MTARPPGERNEKVNAADDAWRQYVAASMAQMYTVAALNELSDIAELEQQMHNLD